MRARSALVGGIAFGAAFAVVAGHRAALSDFRDVESIYVRSRQPSACVVRELAVRIDERDPRPELITDDLPAFLGEAAKDLAREQDAIGEARVLAYPGLADARDATRASIDASVAFYDALLLTPAESADELARFRAAVRVAEDELTDARRWLLVRPGDGWSNRGECTSGP